MKATIVLIIIVLLWGGSASSQDSAGFAVPGVDFRELALKEGAWCRYKVADEALGQVDSSEVYVGVPERVTTPRGAAFWIEIETRMAGGAEREIVKVLVLDNISHFADGDSLGQYILRLYTQTGDRAPQEEDPDDYEGFLLPTADSSWVLTEDIEVMTLAGEFLATRKQRVSDTTREIPSGNVTLVKTARDNFAVWFAEEIPVFRMAKCVIERYRDTKTVPAIPGMPLKGGKASRTTAELLGYGHDAAPLLPQISAF